MRIRYKVLNISNNKEKYNKTDDETRRKEYLEKIKNFCLMDDDFMTKCFENNIEAVEMILRIILDQKKIKLVQIHTQHVIKNLQGHSVQLDILVKDTYGRYYDIEVQRADDGADIHRARYNGSIMDASVLPAGEKYKNLRDVYVIFITENDIFGKGMPIYHCNRINKETGDLLTDGSHILYVNGQYRDETELGWLMHDFCCKEPDEMHYEVLARSVRFFKEDERGINKMCKMLEEMFARMADEIRDDIREEVKSEVREEVKSEVREEVKSEVREEVKSEVREEVKSEVREEVKSEVREEVKSEVREEVKSEVREEVKSEVREEVKKEVREEVMAEVRGELVQSTTKKWINNLVKKGKMTLEDIAECADFSMEEVLRIATE